MDGSYFGLDSHLLHRDFGAPCGPWTGFGWFLLGVRVGGAGADRFPLKGSFKGDIDIDLDIDALWGLRKSLHTSCRLMSCSFFRAPNFMVIGS